MDLYKFEYKRMKPCEQLPLHRQDSWELTYVVLDVANVYSAILRKTSPQVALHLSLHTFHIAGSSTKTVWTRMD